jgi:type I restriction enzyme, S subunit
VQLADVGVAAYRNRSARFLTTERAAALSCTYLQPGDVLVARMPDPLGRACLFPGGTKQAVTVVDVAIVRPANPAVDSRWLMHRINSQQFRQAVASLQSGSTRQRISRRNLSKIAFPIPPLSDQIKAADEIEKQFSRLDEADASLQRVKVNLKRCRASVLKSAVTGGLLPDAHACSWRQAQIGEVAKIIGGLTKNPKRAALPNKLPYLRVANVYADELRSSPNYCFVRATCW